MKAQLNNEPEAQAYFLITIVYKGGSKIKLLANDFSVERNPENGDIKTYDYQGIDIETFNTVAKILSEDDLVFVPLAIGNPEDIAAIYSTPVTSMV